MVFHLKQLCMDLCLFMFHTDALSRCYLIETVTWHNGGANKRNFIWKGHGLVPQSVIHKAFEALNQ